MESWQKWAFPLPSRPAGEASNHRSGSPFGRSGASAGSRRAVTCSFERATRRDRCSVVRGRAHGRVRGRRAVVDAGFRSDGSGRGDWRERSTPSRRSVFGDRLPDTRSSRRPTRCPTWSGSASEGRTRDATPDRVATRRRISAVTVRAQRRFHPFQMMMSRVTRWWHPRDHRGSNREVAPWQRSKIRTSEHRRATSEGQGGSRANAPCPPTRDGSRRPIGRTRSRCSRRRTRRVSRTWCRSGTDG